MKTLNNSNPTGYAASLSTSSSKYSTVKGTSTTPSSLYDHLTNRPLPATNKIPVK